MKNITSIFAKLFVVLALVASFAPVTLAANVKSSAGCLSNFSISSRHDQTNWYVTVGWQNPTSSMKTLGMSAADAVSYESLYFDKIKVRASGAGDYTFSFPIKSAGPWVVTVSAYNNGNGSGYACDGTFANLYL